MQSLKITKTREMAPKFAVSDVLSQTLLNCLETSKRLGTINNFV